MRRAERLRRDRRRAEREAALRASLADVQLPEQYHNVIMRLAVPWHVQPRRVHLITPDFDLACSHDGEDDSSAVPAEVTCQACLTVLGRRPVSAARIAEVSEAAQRIRS